MPEEIPEANRDVVLGMLNTMHGLSKDIAGQEQAHDGLFRQGVRRDAGSPGDRELMCNLEDAMMSLARQLDELASHVRANLNPIAPPADTP